MNYVEEYKNLFNKCYAPVLIEFVRWVLLDAKKKGINKLYFLSRDGYLMYHTAKKIVDLFDIHDLDIRYLEVSRYSLRRATYHMNPQTYIDTICLGGIDVTFRKIMKRAGLEDNEVTEIAKELGYENRLDEILNKNKTHNIKSKLLESSLFEEKVFAHSINAYTDAIGYFIQEGLCEGNTVSIVDSGWVGSIQESIRELISSNTSKDISVNGYYFGLYEVPRNANLLDYNFFYFGPRGDVSRKATFSNCLFEAIYSAPHGMCLGYEARDGRFDSIRGEDNINAEYIRASCDVLNEYIEENLTNIIYKNVNVEKILVNSMSRPTREEVKVLSQLKFCDDIVEHEFLPIAREFSIEDIKSSKFIKRICNKLLNKNYVEKISGWPEGSIVQCGYKTEYYLRQEQLYKKLMYIRKALIRK